MKILEAIAKYPAEQKTKDRRCRRDRLVVCWNRRGCLDVE